MKRMLSFALVMIIVGALIVGCDQLPTTSSSPISVESDAQGTPAGAQSPAATEGPIMTIPTPEAVTLPDGSPDADVIASHNNLGFKVLNGLAEGGRNVIISPTSISLALELIANAASDDSLAGIQEVLGTGVTPSHANEENAKLLRMLTVDTPSGNAADLPKVTLANAVFTKEEASDGIKNITRSYYRTPVVAFDFSSPSAKESINQYISDCTSGMVPELIDEELDPATALAIVSALYFEGKFATPFESSRTSTGTFSGASNQVDAEFMDLTSTFSYGDYADGQVAVLPYVGGYNLVLMLPDGDAAPESYLFDFTAEKFKSMLESLSQESVTVKLPAFEIECEFSLRESLEAAGMTNCFNGAEKGGFDKLVTSGSSHLINDILHGSYINMCEAGTTTAGAVPAVTESASPAAPSNNPYELTFNRPFAFAIVHAETGEILFLGAVNEL